jgi:hypothetical protein
MTMQRPSVTEWKLVYGPVVVAFLVAVGMFIASKHGTVSTEEVQPLLIIVTGLVGSLMAWATWAFGSHKDGDGGGGNGKQ